MPTKSEESTWERLSKCFIILTIVLMCAVGPLTTIVEAQQASGLSGNNVAFGAAAKSWQSSNTALGTLLTVVTYAANYVCPIAAIFCLVVAGFCIAFRSPFKSWLVGFFALLCISGIARLGEDMVRKGSQTLIVGH